MSALGTATLDFGAWPGSAQASVTVNTAGIATNSQVAGGVRLEATTDHSADEAMIEQIKITCGAIVANTSFVLYGECMNSLTYGVFTCQWCWC